MSNSNDQSPKHTRRDFLRASAALGAGASMALSSAASYARILGANDRMNLAFAGVRSRGKALIESAAAVGGNSVNVHTLCDVDSNVLADISAFTSDLTGSAPAAVADYRRVVDDREVDAVFIATPDHTHAPFAVYSMEAGQDVYLEKPCSHNPYEGELLVKAKDRYGRVVQMGNQQRSAPTSIEAVGDIRDGLIGTPYMGKAWYANTRGSIGTGRVADVPDWLDWDLWQGPAPRVDYRDNLVHYNWHWFWHWGTGEINNNALHEMDICRWALGVELPNRVTSSGGRYHFDDDWEFFDTQIATYEYEGGKQIAWEGRSCNGHPFFDRGRGATIHGTDGTVMLDRNGYSLYDHGGKLIKQVNERARSGTTDVVGGGALDNLHIGNFFAAIRDGAALHSPIEDGHISTLMCHLGNIAQVHGGALDIDPATGRIRNNREAMRLWRRDYAPGWEPKV